MDVISSGAFDLYKADGKDDLRCALCRKAIIPGQHMWRVVVGSPTTNTKRNAGTLATCAEFRYAHRKCETCTVRRCIESRERKGITASISVSEPRLQHRPARVEQICGSVSLFLRKGVVMRYFSHEWGGIFQKGPWQFVRRVLAPFLRESPLVKRNAIERR